MAAFQPVVAPQGEIITVPVASAGITATAGAANTYGAYVQLDDGTLVTADMRLVSVGLRTPSAAQVGKVQIVYDEAGTPVPICEVDFEIATDAGGYLNIPVPTGRIIPSGETIGARVKSVAGATTITVSVGIQAMS